VFERYSSDGSRDPSFGFSQEIITQSGTDFDSISQRIFVQDDGKILMPGSHWSNPAGGVVIGHITLRRYNADGGPDLSFGNQGLAATVDVSTTSLLYLDSAINLAFQNDGSIVLTGKASDLSTLKDKIGVWRLTSTGAVDYGFGTNGRALVSESTTSVGVGRAVAIQPDQKIAILGNSTTTNLAQLAMARLLPDGTMDPDFNGGQVLKTSTANSAAFSSVLLQQSGKIVGIGEMGSEIVVARYTANGAADISSASPASPICRFRQAVMSCAHWPLLRPQTT
jgi:uncharacterized delta-60 repeat protein